MAVIEVYPKGLPDVLASARLGVVSAHAGGGRVDPARLLAQSAQVPGASPSSVFGPMAARISRSVG